MVTDADTCKWLRKFTPIGDETVGVPRDGMIKKIQPELTEDKLLQSFVLAGTQRTYLPSAQYIATKHFEVVQVVLVEIFVWWDVCAHDLVNYHSNGLQVSHLAYPYSTTSSRDVNI